jgi:hypothetical protein
MNNNDIYYNKYLKYKNKYLLEKNKLNQKGGVNHPACAVIRNDQLFPTIAIKDKTGFIYYDAKYDSKNNHYYGKWCNNPTMGEWSLDANIIVSKQIINNREELLKLCHC